MLKPLKITIFWPNLYKNGVPMGHTQNKKRFFFAEITKPDHKLSKTFYFIKISYVLAELWIFFYFVWCFLLKSVISSHNSCEGIMLKYQTNLGIHGNILLIKQIDLLLEVPKTTTWNGSKTTKNIIKFSTREGVDLYKILH